eukprot:CAMPEP_0202725698 /NCGR_PEP_ID=MMETSP1385-20130828/184228_1 /ASSEMBLY_ACC=CAM_ASM_000861 /TAXON_ID=933848 /ORGANISM="Elphidium margaritaceum" /LENGTH=148 /DNA_ID=CAMNT_0049391901 /DNA_START=260 /DNA_END=703 /DNA_ORIENTATION=+
MNTNHGFLSTLKQQSITLSRNAMEVLPTASSWDEFVHNGYSLYQHDDDNFEDHTPFLVLLSLDSESQYQQIEATFDSMVLRLRKDTIMLQNTLMVITMHTSSLLYGARIPTKRRGKSVPVSDVVLEGNDLQSLLLHFSDDNERGSSLW